jgi:tripartite-type tricarboxylate transporter receptor subunit TctC
VGTFGKVEDGMVILSKALSMVAFMAAIAPAVCAAEADKAWPNRAVRIIVPIAPGGATDTAARLYADGLSRRWGQPVVIENRPGADTHLATAEFIRPRDDHTLLWGLPGTFTINPLVLGTAPFDPEDLVPVSATASTVLLVAVHTGVPARSLGELGRLAQAGPGKLVWGAAPGFPRYGFTAFLKGRSLDMPFVPYRDIATPAADLGEGRLHVLVSSVLATNAPVQSGKARIIAVLDGQRAPMLPDVPTAAEAGYPEMTVDVVAGFFGWRDMPAALRDRISGDVQAIAKDPTVRSRLEATGQIALASTPAEFAATIERQRVRILEIVRLIDLKAPAGK